MMFWDAFTSLADDYKWKLTVLTGADVQCSGYAAVLAGQLISAVALVVRVDGRGSQGILL